MVVLTTRAVRFKVYLGAPAFGNSQVNIQVERDPTILCI